ncbi:MAG: aminotransferase [Sphingomonadales bacterium]|nr:aminotransferase [Sphingomonadales bacterium]
MTVTIGHPVYAGMGRTIFDHMSGLARELGAINLGQGFPEGPEPRELIEAAARALRERSNQYPPSAGLPELRDAVAAYYGRRQRLALERGNVVVTSGATEAICSAVLALVQPGDEVLLFAPAYDAYAPMVRRCGGVPVFVALRPPGWGYDETAIRAAISARTRVVMLNDPLNPMGTVATPDELAMLARLCLEHDLLAICDEVWEEVRFDGRAHASLLGEPGMADRVVKIGSAGKLFGMTGWKIGWMIAGEELATLVARAHQFVTFTTAPALQWAVAEGLGWGEDWFEGQHAARAAQRARLQGGLAEAGFAVMANAATWFVCVDLAASGIALDDTAFSERAVREAGVASIPVSALYEEADAPKGFARLCFTKPDAQIDEAVARLGRFRAGL